MNPTFSGTHFHRHMPFDKKMVTKSYSLKMALRLKNRLAAWQALQRDYTTGSTMQNSAERGRRDQAGCRNCEPNTFSVVRQDSQNQISRVYTSSYSTTTRQKGAPAELRLRSSKAYLKLISKVYKYTIWVNRYPTITL